MSGGCEWASRRRRAHEGLGCSKVAHPHSALGVKSQSSCSCDYLPGHSGRHANRSASRLPAHAAARWPLRRAVDGFVASSLLAGSRMKFAEGRPEACSTGGQMWTGDARGVGWRTEDRCEEP